jgi:hypothetical protein
MSVYNQIMISGEETVFIVTDKLSVAICAKTSLCRVTMSLHLDMKSILQSFVECKFISAYHPSGWLCLVFVFFLICRI